MNALTGLPPTCQSVKVAMESGYFFFFFERGVWGIEGLGFGRSFCSPVVWSLFHGGCGGVLYAMERLRGQSAASRTGRCPGEGNSLQTPVWTQSRDWHVFSVKGQAVNILLFF